MGTETFTISQYLKECYNFLDFQVRKLPHRHNVKLIPKLIGVTLLLIDHIWKFYDLISLCWTIF